MEISSQKVGNETMCNFVITNRHNESGKDLQHLIYANTSQLSEILKLVYQNVNVLIPKKC